MEVATKLESVWLLYKSIPLFSAIFLINLVKDWVILGQR
jgi:hypothetical protein